MFFMEIYDIDFLDTESLDTALAILWYNKIGLEIEDILRKKRERSAISVEEGRKDILELDLNQRFDRIFDLEVDRYLSKLRSMHRELYELLEFRRWDLQDE